MIFCKSRKFIFLRVPKTASTSLSLQIQKNMDFQAGDFATGFYDLQHVGLDRVRFNAPTSLMETFKTNEHADLCKFMDLNIISRKELDSYSIYGVLRSPIDRFFSLFYHLIVVHPHLKLDAKKMNKEQIATFAFSLLESAKKKKTDYKYFVVDGSTSNYPMWPQSHWLIFDGQPINNIVIHPNFDEMLIKLTGSPELQFREKVGHKPVDSGISESTIEQIRYWYAEDFDLWEKFGPHK